MKSNKQRREEIKQRRIARATPKEVGLPALALSSRRLRWGDVEPANLSILMRYNNTYGELPTCYVERSFTCCDCGCRQVWSAQQQKWWYEVVHGSIHSRAVRCLPCRRAKRKDAQAGEGANLLSEECMRLRALAQSAPTAAARVQIEAALQSKWWGLRLVAIQVLGHWGGKVERARLRAIINAYSLNESHGWHDSMTWPYLATNAAQLSLSRCF